MLGPLPGRLDGCQARLHGKVRGLGAAPASRGLPWGLWGCRARGSICEEGPDRSALPWARAHAILKVKLHTHLWTQVPPGRRGALPTPLRADSAQCSAGEAGDGVPGGPRRSRDPPARVDMRQEALPFLTRRAFPNRPKKLRSSQEGLPSLPPSWPATGSPRQC